MKVPSQRSSDPRATGPRESSVVLRVLGDSARSDKAPRAQEARQERSAPNEPNFSTPATCHAAPEPRRERPAQNEPNSPTARIWRRHGGKCKCFYTKKLYILLCVLCASAVKSRRVGGAGRQTNPICRRGGGFSRRAGPGSAFGAGFRHQRCHGSFGALYSKASDRASATVA